MHLILIGLPGAGKTTVGREVATRLGWGFVDFDAEISRRQALSVSEIFAWKGEPFFRALERELTEELERGAPRVVSPGGGWVTSAETVRIARPIATLVYLRVSPETAVARLGSDLSSRPLLRADPLAAMSKLFGERCRAYEQADVTIDSELLTQQGVVDTIVALRSGSGNAHPGDTERGRA